MRFDDELEFFRHTTDEMNELFLKKRMAYGATTTETYQKFGPVSMLTRMHDKIGRLDNLLIFAGKNDLDESVRDTLMDLANYAIIMLLEMTKADMEKHVLQTEVDNTQRRY